MTPAAYHRIVHAGEDTPEVDRFAARFVLGALVPLALGLGTESFVFTVRAFEDVTLAAITSVVVAVCLLTVWFGLPLAIRGAREPRRTAAAAGE